MSENDHLQAGERLRIFTGTTAWTDTIITASTGRRLPLLRRRITVDPPVDGLTEFDVQIVRYGWARLSADGSSLDRFHAVRSDRVGEGGSE